MVAHLNRGDLFYGAVRKCHRVRYLVVDGSGNDDGSGMRPLLATRRNRGRTTGITRCDDGDWRWAGKLLRVVILRSRRSLRVDRSLVIRCVRFFRCVYIGFRAVYFTFHVDVTFIFNCLRVLIQSSVPLSVQILFFQDLWKKEKHRSWRSTLQDSVHSQSIVKSAWLDTFNDFLTNDIQRLPCMG